jgi:NADH dehydrogenase
VEGTRNVVAAAQAANVEKLIFISFLRARPNCGSAYHESKWAAEELVRSSGLDYTILKEGITYGNGDHMLHHLSWALSHLPVFAFVGFHEKPIRPVSVHDLVEIILASLVHGRLSRATVAVVGPEEMTLSQAVRRVARVMDRRPLFIRLPVAAHKLLAILWEALMDVPLASRAQVFILSEGIVEPAPPAPFVPADLAPKRRFTDEQIIEGLPHGSLKSENSRTSHAHVT